MDDEEPILELASLTLRHFGYEVMVAKDAGHHSYAQALEVAGPFPPSSWTTIPGGMGGKEAMKSCWPLIGR